MTIVKFTVLIIFCCIVTLTGLGFYAWNLDQNYIERTRTCEMVGVTTWAENCYKCPDGFVYCGK